MTFSFTGANSAEQMNINRKVGKLGEKFAKEYYREHGYYTLDPRSGMFFDFIAMRMDLRNWKLKLIFVEVKVGAAQLSKRQVWFKRWCKKANQEFDVHHITKKHLEYLMGGSVGGGIVA